MGWIIQEVKQRVAEHYACSNPRECDVHELVALQWGSSGVTNNITGIYQNSPYLTNTKTLQDWLPITDLSRID